MKIDPPSTLRAFATLRFEGDALVPSLLSDALRTDPTLAYRKGERYRLGRRGIEKLARTGCWFLDTRDRCPADDLDAHAGLIAALLSGEGAPPGRVDRREGIAEIVERGGLGVRVTLFWFGRSGASPPNVGPALTGPVGRLGGTVELDFSMRSDDPGMLEGHAA